jgi:cobalt transporter subunit CbtB
MSIRTGSATWLISGGAVPLVLLFLGMTTLLVMGFLPGSLLHEFVHDARHLLAFPCH